jgi:hypothetical protein
VSVTYLCHRSIAGSQIGTKKGVAALGRLISVVAGTFQGNEELLRRQWEGLFVQGPVQGPVQGGSISSGCGSSRVPVLVLVVIAYAAIIVLFVEGKDFNKRPPRRDVSVSECSIRYTFSYKLFMFSDGYCVYCLRARRVLHPVKLPRPATCKCETHDEKINDPHTQQPHFGTRHI